MPIVWSEWNLIIIAVRCSVFLHSLCIIPNHKRGTDLVSFLFHRDTPICYRLVSVVLFTLAFTIYCPPPFFTVSHKKKSMLGMAIMHGQRCWPTSNGSSGIAEQKGRTLRPAGIVISLTLFGEFTLMYGHKKRKTSALHWHTNSSSLDL